MSEFFEDGLPIVGTQPKSTLWFAVQVSDTTYGAFAAFATEEDRARLLAGGGPQLAQKYRHLFVAAPTFEKVDVLAVRLDA